MPPRSSSAPCRRSTRATPRPSRQSSPTQHFTEPPPRYTEATLIKALEEHGIGRPSTYAATISTILDRGYVSVQERRLRPEPVGEIVNDFLVDHFGSLVDLEFTARMEEDLDEVAGGKRKWVPLVRAFYTPLEAAVEATNERRPAAAGCRPTEVCSEGHPMVIRAGRYGDYLACANYPEHKETRPLARPDEPLDANGGALAELPGVGEPCPECGPTAGGTLVAKRGRFGPFVGCARYPDCKYIKKDGPPPPDQLPFEVACPKCGQGHLTARRARRTGTVFWGCSRYPKCDFTTSREPVGAVHDADGGPVARNTVPAARPDEPRRRPNPAGRTPGTCLKCGASIPLPAGDLVGQSLAGGPADPAALHKPGRAGRPAGRGRTSTAGRAERPRSHAADHEDARIGDHRERARRVTGDEARDRFLDGLTARDASPHTRRAYATVVGAYLAWLDERGTDWRRPARADLRAYLARLGDGVARSSVGQRLAALRSFYRFTTRNGWTDGDPWRSIATPRMPRRLPRVLEVEEVERLLDAIDPSTRPNPLALRDRAIVETAYAAGLRISELAGAEPRLGGPPAGRDPGDRQGPQGTDRAARSPGARCARRPTSSRAGRSSWPGPRTAPSLPAGGVPEPPRRAARSSRPAPPPRRAAGPGRAAPGRLAAYPAPQLRYPPARRGGRPAGRPGAARPREPGHDPDLYPRLAEPPAGGLRGSSPARPPGSLNAAR